MMNWSISFAALWRKKRRAITLVSRDLFSPRAAWFISAGKPPFQKILKLKREIAYPIPSHPSLVSVRQRSACMLNRVVRFSSLLFLTLAVFAQTSPSPQQKSDAQSTKKAEKPKSPPNPGQTAPPANPSASKTAETSAQRPAPKFDIANLDKSVDPCADFYQFACGNWIKNNPIPADYSSWESFGEVYEHNLSVLHGILEKASANDPKRSLVIQKIGDDYASCMLEKAMNQKGISALKPELDRVANVKDKTQMIAVMAHLWAIGPNPLFGFSSQPDFHNADMTVA